MIPNFEILNNSHPSNAEPYQVECTFILVA